MKTLHSTLLVSVLSVFAALVTLTTKADETLKNVQGTWAK